MTQHIVLKQNTLTLAFPTLNDLVQLTKTAKPGTRIDLAYYKLTGKVPGLQLCPVPGTLSTWTSSWVIDADDLCIANGSIVLDGHTSLIITGKNVLFKNVCISGLGRKGLQRPDPFLIHVSNGASVRFDACILECEGQEPHTLLVTGASTCTITSTRVFGTYKGAALKLCSSTVHVNKRSLLQGGVIVTSNPAGNKTLDCTVEAFSQPAPHMLQTTPAPVKDSAANDTDADQQAEYQGTSTQDSPIQDSEPTLLTSTTPADTDSTTATADQMACTQDSTAGATAGTIATSLQPPSLLEIRNSEVLAGPVSCLAAHGRSTVLCAGCLIRGSVNFGIIASHGAQLELQGCTVEGACNAGVSVTSGATLKATDSTVSGDTMGLHVKLGGTASLTHCSVRSRRAADGVPHPEPPAPKPGRLGPFTFGTPAPVEVCGKGSSLFAEDCLLGALGVQGYRQIQGAEVCIQQGLAEAMKPLKALAHP